MNAEMEMENNKRKKLIKKRTIIGIGIAICLALSLALYYLPQPLTELTGIDDAGQVTKLFLEKGGADGTVKALSGKQCSEAVALLKTLHVQRTGKTDTVTSGREYFYSIQVGQAEADEAERFSVTSDGRVFFRGRVYLIQEDGKEAIRALDAWYEGAPDA